MATQDDFVKWMNRSAILSKISQKPRSIGEWANDFAKALELHGEAEDTKPPPARREMGTVSGDPGAAGIFGAARESMGLIDPELDDDGEEEEETW